MAVLSTILICMDMLDDKLVKEMKQLLKVLLNFLGVTCGSANNSILTTAYLLGDDKVNI